MSVLRFAIPVLFLAPACADDSDTPDTGNATEAEADSGSGSESGSGDAADDAASGSDTGAPGSDGATTGEPLPPGMCDGGDHGPYLCECDVGETEACEEGGMRACFEVDQEVLTEEAWGPCGECLPGAVEECTTDAGEPGRRFCDVGDVYAYGSVPSAIAWGSCLAEADIACEPGADAPCPDGGMAACLVDGEGVPFVDCD